MKSNAHFSKPLPSPFYFTAVNFACRSSSLLPLEPSHLDAVSRVHALDNLQPSVALVTVAVSAELLLEPGMASLRLVIRHRNHQASAYPFQNAPSSCIYMRCMHILPPCCSASRCTLWTSLASCMVCGDLIGTRCCCCVHSERSRLSTLAASFFISSRSPLRSGATFSSFSSLPLTWVGVEAGTASVASSWPLGLISCC